MTKTARLALAAGLFGLAAAGSAETRPPILVTDPTGRTYRAAVQRFAELGPGRDPARPARLREDLVRALEFSGLFTSIGTEAFLGPQETPSLDGALPVCANWSQIGADALVEGETRASGADLAVEFRVADVARGCLSLARKVYRGAASDETRLARVIADDVVAAFTGTRGVSDTEIAFVSDRSGAKEIYVMEADGSNARRATRNRSINNFPDWSPDGRDIVYTSYREGARPALYLLTRGGNSPGRILRGFAGGAQLYRAVFDPEGERLAVVASHDGAAEIYVVGRGGRNPRRLTHDRSIDIGPAWSPDGRQLAFVSDRTGSPQIYVMSADGGGLRRLTYDGSYNTSPAWSPDGRWIAYETRANGQFDVWLIDPEGTVNVPLVTHPRSDESPSWSPDGRKLAFASTRRGRSDIYVVDVTGENLQRLTEGAGENTSPSWGPWRR
jgi:TolB protein